MSTPDNRRASALDPAALDRHRAALWRYLRVLGADDSTADDLVQEAFIVALERAAFDASVAASAFVFLRTTARHLWLKSHRRTLSRREVEHADEVWQQHCEADGSGYVDALRRCVADLPARSRALLEATYAERVGRADAARRFAMSEDGVKSALRRLRARLHECIERRRKS